jgi:hypothetical protein
MQKLISVVACSSVVWNADGTRFMWYDGESDCLKMNQNISNENLLSCFQRIQNNPQVISTTDNVNIYKNTINTVLNLKYSQTPINEYLEKDDSKIINEKTIFDYNPMSLANPYVNTEYYPYYKKHKDGTLTFKDLGSAPFQKIKYKQSRGRKIKRYNTATKISKKVNTPVKSKKLKQKKYKQTRGRKIKRFRNKSV